MKIQNVLASVAVKDLASATKWYEKVFQRSADSTPMPQVSEWRFPRGGWLQAYQSAERAGRCSCTFAVDNLDEVIAHLKGVGVETGKEITSKKTRVIMINDADGNSLAFAEARDRSMAR